MAKRTLKSVEENLIAGIKQAVVDIDAGETDAYIKFNKDGSAVYLINMIGSYTLLYMPINDMIILAWGLRTQASPACLINCSWGNGTYFNSLPHATSINDKYDWDTISRYVIDRI